MALLFSFVIFLLFAAGLSFAGVKMYVKPKEAIERVAGTGMSTHDAAPVHPSLLFRDLVKRLGNLVPASPKDVTVMQRRLIRAGYRNPTPSRSCMAPRPFSPFCFQWWWRWPSTTRRRSRATKSSRFWFPWRPASSAPTNTCAWPPSAAKTDPAGLANSLDLMVVCVESGLGLDQAIMQVAKELEHAHPEISEELAIVNLELKAGKRRPEALRNLADGLRWKTSRSSWRC